MDWKLTDNYPKVKGCGLVVDSSDPDDLIGLFQPKRSYNSIKTIKISYHFFVLKSKPNFLHWKSKGTIMNIDTLRQPDFLTFKGA